MSRAARGAGIALVALAALAAAGPVRAGARVEARSAFAGARRGDPAVIEVIVTNDARPRRATLVAFGVETGADRRTQLALDLPPDARKRVLLPLPPLPDDRVEVRLDEDGLTVGQAVAGVPRSDHHGPLVLVLGEAPSSLRAATVRDRSSALAEVAPADLPVDAGAWPGAATIVWPAPRPGVLSPEQARALAGWVRAGGHLVAGATHEEPDGLARAGLADLAPARLARGADPAAPLEIVARAGDAIEPPGAAWARSPRGWGTVTQVPSDLALAGGLAWSTVLGLEADPNAWRWDPNAYQLEGYLGWSMQPKPPLALASLVIAAFFVIGVPLDVVLARRDLRTGRRTAWRPLLYPASVAAATGLALLVADGAGGSGHAARRVDVVFLDPDGAPAHGRTHLALSRGRSGDVRASVPRGVHLESIHLQAEPYGGRSAPEEVALSTEGQDGRVAGAELELPSWTVLHLTATWSLDDAAARELLARVGPSDLLSAQYWDGSTAETRRAPPSTDSFDAFGDHLSESFLRAPQPWRTAAVARPSRPARHLFARAALGPELRVDGARVEDAERYVLVAAMARPGDRVAEWEDLVPRVPLAPEGTP